jgi:ATP-binding cassette subfamily F protein 3
VFDQEKSRLDNELRLVKIDLDKVKGGNDVDVSWAKGKLRRLTRDVITIEQLGVMALKSENWLTLSQQIEGQTRPWGYDECERRVRSLRRPAPPPRIEFGVAAVNRGSNDVIVAENLVVGYDKTLFVCDALLLQRGARVAVIGANGSGKTTFIKTLFGAVPTRGGKLHLGASVHVGYFAQAHDRLNLQARLLDELLTHAPHLRDEQGRHYLAKFLFKGDDVYKFVYGLSGGERARLALAILALQKPNLLVLDEPTNHLDIYALEALEQVLANYNGSMLFVTHDRQLVDKLATEIWYIEHGRMHIFRGRYDGWRRFKNQSLIIKPSESKAKSQALDLERAAQSRGDTHSKNELRRREQAIATIEREVSLCDAALTELSAQIAANPPYEQLMALTAEYESAQLKLNEAILRWERVMNEFAT